MGDRCPGLVACAFDVVEQLRVESERADPSAEDLGRFEHHDRMAETVERVRAKETGNSAPDDRDALRRRGAGAHGRFGRRWRRRCFRLRWCAHQSSLALLSESVCRGTRWLRTRAGPSRGHRKSDYLDELCFKQEYSLYTFRPPASSLRPAPSAPRGSSLRYANHLMFLSAMRATLPCHGSHVVSQSISVARPVVRPIVALSRQVHGA